MAEVQLLLAVVLVVVLVAFGAFVLYAGLGAVFAVGLAVFAIGLCAGGSAGFAVGGGAGFCILAGRLGTYFLGAYFLADGFLRSLGGGADGHGGSDDGREHKGEFLHSYVSFSLSYFALL